MQKHCGCCEKTLPITEFYTNKSQKSGVNSRCKGCQSAYLREYAKRNAQALSESRKKKLNMDGERERRAEWKREYYLRNREAVLADCAAYRAANGAKLSESRAARRAPNIEKIRQQEREGKKRNADKVRQRMADYRRRARAANPMVAVKDRLRARIGLAFRGAGYTKRSTLTSILGCSYEQLMAHIESLFSEGMTWENRGQWHIDHIVPLASAKCEADLMQLCHYRNLQPLWGVENLKKGASLAA